MKHIILGEDSISFSFFFFFHITKDLSRFTRDQNLFLFFLVEESVYKVILSTHSYRILKI
jgi:hypothetical protein